MLQKSAWDSTYMAAAKWGSDPYNSFTAFAFNIREAQLSHL